MSPEDMQRFEIEGIGSEVYGGILIRCYRCPWEAWINTFGGAVGEGPSPKPVTFGELNRLAEEHTEACR